MNDEDVSDRQGRCSLPSSHASYSRCAGGFPGIRQVADRRVVEQIRVYYARTRDTLESLGVDGVAGEDAGKDQRPMCYSAPRIPTALQAPALPPKSFSQDIVT